MKIELFNKWIAALESGEYKQCDGKLFNGEGYCCLGVLQKVAGVEIEDDQVFLTPSFANIIGMNEKGHPISETEGETEGEWVIYRPLSYLNDDGVNFTVIADILKKNPLKYIKSLED